MPVIFTICSNNYLAQATVLGNSVAKHYPDTKLITILVDHLHPSIDYTTLPFETIPIANIEPRISELADKYNIIELNTCVKPQAFKYLFEEYPDENIIYLDPDVKVFSPLYELEELFTFANIILTPHVFSPIAYDNKIPHENIFLNFGLYNLGFIAIRNTEESGKFLDWWKARTYENGFYRLEEGVFVDQLYINLAPLFFKDVHILAHRGYNMAPWNLQERYLSEKEGRLLVNDEYDLRFYHFGSFKFDVVDLPIHHYNRFNLSQRPDLRTLYEEYNQNLRSANYPAMHAINCVYYDQYVDAKLALIEKVEQSKWQRHSLSKKLMYKIIPLSVFKSLGTCFNRLLEGYPYSDDEQTLKRKYRL